MNEIFMMGYDVWSDGLDEKEYLLICHNSEKYKSGQFKVLVKNSKNKMLADSIDVNLAQTSHLMASLIVYKFDDITFGIGSIAVSVPLRGCGYGSTILKMVVDKLMFESKDCIIFLYSDIDKFFYEKLGFAELPSEFQNHKTTTCMFKSNIQQRKIFKSGFKPPEYF